jgi:Cdc6-like AAA superfamily ATPase
MSQDAIDSEEFNSIATAASKRSSDSPPTTPSDLNNNSAEYGDVPGKMVQYALNGPGFRPATATVPALPPGIYTLGFVNDVCTFLPQTMTTDELLRLPDSMSDTVISEIERFWKMKSEFTRLGFAHKRGFLLWGPPGSGKTSTLKFVTAQLVKAGGVVVICNLKPEVVAAELQHLRQIEPDRPLIVLMEDIDAIIKTYGEADMLSLLDGESSIDNVIFLATTNYPDELDGRVVNRPSRFDRVIKIGTPSAEARRAYLLSRKLSLTEEELETWVKETKDFSVAHIKELIVGVFCYGNLFENDIKRLRAMAKTPKNDNENPTGFNRS